MPKFKIKDKVEKTGGDYTFRGKVIGIFNKLTRDLEEFSDEIRLAVQNYEGVIHIYSEKNLRKVENEFEVSKDGATGENPQS